MRYVSVPNSVSCHALAPVFRNVEKNLLFLSEAVDHYQV